MIFFGFLRWKWQRDKGQRKSQLTHWCAHIHTLHNAQPHSKNSWWLYIYVCACVCGWVDAFKCASSSHVSLCSLHILYHKISLPLNKACSLKWGKTQENQSYNYPHFLCHFKRRRTLWPLYRCGGGWAWLSFFISTNFVLKESTVLSIPSADIFVQWQEGAGEEKQENKHKAERKRCL